MTFRPPFRHIHCRMGGLDTWNPLAPRTWDSSRKREKVKGRGQKRKEKTFLINTYWQTEASCWLDREPGYQASCRALSCIRYKVFLFPLGRPKIKFECAMYQALRVLYIMVKLQEF